jgi:hypothetical protein
VSLTLNVQVVFYPELLASPEQQAEILDKLRDFSPILETRAGELVEQEQAESFETRNWGGWAALAPSTVRDKARHGFGGRPDLVREGTLQAAFVPGMPGHKFLVGPSSLIVGVYGEVIPFVSTLARGDASRRLPPRILISMRPGTVELLVEILAEWLGGGEAIRVYADAPIER